MCKRLACIYLTDTANIYIKISGDAALHIANLQAVFNDFCIGIGQALAWSSVVI
tara:strand:- start:4832 stop:4993 length:162 start_codon:yes stop_codon:yes gene_type:complete